MTDVLKSDQHLSPMESIVDILNTSDDGEKKKKVYTTDFLRQFDKSTPIHQQTTQSYHPMHGNGVSFFTDFDNKDRQISEYIGIIQKLKAIIVHSKDDSLINSMRAILLDSIHGSQLVQDIPPIPNLAFIGDQSSFFSNPIGNVSGSLPPIGRGNSPRKEVPPIQVPTIPQQPTPAAVATTSSITGVNNSNTNKSPRKLNTSGSGSQISLPTLNNSNTTNVTAQSVPPVSNTTTSTTTSNNINNNSTTAAGSKIKKSPSMPSIKNQIGVNGKEGIVLPFESNTISRPKPTLTKSTSNTNITSITKQKDGDSSPPKKLNTDNQPRKPMTKSVSMGSIISDNSLPIKCTSLEEITGQIYQLTKYQAGCRFLQKKLEEKPDSEHVTLIFNEVYDHLIELMVDPYGQYLIPQLMKYCDNNQRKMIVDKIAPKVETFACHIYGIHGIQKVLQFLAPEQVESIIRSIKDKVVQLSKDGKGNYLIQSFLKSFSPETNQFIVDAVMNNVMDICTHKVGCTVVNRCIDNSNPHQLVKLIDSITSHSLPLVQDQYGNYVVQHLLSNNKSYATKLIKSLAGNIAHLSVQKFSSNVIEKCLQVANEETYDLIIKELTEADILTLLQDKYANFVIQTALDVADENQHAKLVKLIVPYIHQIKTPYVIHIQKKILQI